MEIIAGAWAGICAAVIGQPFDTIKVRSQLNIKSSHFLKGLYRGISAQIGIQMISNSLLFGLYGQLNKTMDNKYLAAFSTGLVEGLVYSPLELIKTKRQANLPAPKWPEFHHGLKLCMMRESLGNCVYFGTYEYFRNKTTNLSKTSSIIYSGALAGCCYWIAIFPIDTIRVRVQANGFTVKQAIDYRQFYKGIGPCLVRAIPVNCVTFWGYEMAMERLGGRGLV
jgi:solute carrier family 25 carnitine/acylcarnitine transporter 20/29